jgi:hypothetical protein
MALSNLGADTITSLLEDSKNARRVNTIYNLVRDIMISGHPWNFAIKRVELGLLSESPLYGFSNAFQLPADYLRVLDANIADEKFVVENNKRLLTDEDEVEIRYIARIDEPSKFSQGFIQAFADELTARLAYPITNSRSLANDARQLAIATLKIAKAQDAQEGIPEDLDAKEWINARFKSQTGL